MVTNDLEDLGIVPLPHWKKFSVETDFEGNEFRVYYHEGGDVYDLSIYGRPWWQLFSMGLGMVQTYRAGGGKAWLEVREEGDELEVVS